ncbi:CRISPR-associated endonuclease Cas2 [Desulforamulus ferrireducens]|uniref:CRISPR-associated endoribonuclease Cas2 n=1 Tax=Desulforamulus ferrireducens TaxID=1833852 RepID=A0A1S6IZJ1_9FIRM|nr:CRISPR-associated endonuclease Cas2 [Desulforamulus ferrireducens]
MSSRKMYYLICYDIREPKRWRKCYKLLKGFGERVQYSVFKCYLTDRKLAELRWELTKILSNEDSLLIAPIQQADVNRIIYLNMNIDWQLEKERFRTV